MKIKSLFQKISVFTCLIITPLCADMPRQPMMPDMSPAEIAEMEKMFDEIINNLDPETLAALEELGNQIIQEAQENGYDDPFEYIMHEAEREFPQDFPPLPTEKPTEPVVVQPPVTGSKATHLKTLIANLISDIAAIRQKAASNNTFASVLADYKYHIDDIIYYLNLIQTNPYLINYVLSTEFEPLHASLEKLHQSLHELMPQLEVPEFSLEGKVPHVVLGIPYAATQDEIVEMYQQKVKALEPQALKISMIAEGKSTQEIDKKIAEAKATTDDLVKAYSQLRSQEKSKFVFEKIMQAFADAIHQEKLLQEFTKLLKRYEPDALKMKEAQEKLEATARAEQEKAAKKRASFVTNPNFTMPAYSEKDPYYGNYATDYGYKGGRSDYYPSDYSRGGRGGEGWSPSSMGGDKTQTKPGEGGKGGGKQEPGKGGDDKKGPNEPAKGGKGKGGKGDGKDGKDGGKKGLNPDVQKKVDGLAKNFNLLDSILNPKSPITPNGLVLKDFAEYLTKDFDIAHPDDEVPALNDKRKFLDELAGVLKAIQTSVVNDIKELAKKTPDTLAKTLVAEYKEATKNLIAKFEKEETFKNSFRPLLDAATLVDNKINVKGKGSTTVPASKRALFYGKNETTLPKSDRELLEAIDALGGPKLLVQNPDDTHDPKNFKDYISIIEKLYEAKDGNSIKDRITPQKRR